MKGFIFSSSGAIVRGCLSYPVQCYFLFPFCHISASGVCLELRSRLHRYPVALMYSRAIPAHSKGTYYI